MHWKRKSWILIGVLLAAFAADATAQIVTTQVADTVYHADGTAATGTVLISWPAFTTSGGTSVPSGNTSAAIAAGALSVQLVPNAGANPVGTYYTVVYHLDDGTVSRQYWVVPASASSVRISAIESTVVPISVAMQTVSKSYVDTAIATAFAGVSGGSGGSGGVQLGGDLSGTNTAPVVSGLRGHPISSASPSTGQTLVWSGSSYVPATPSSGFTAAGDLGGTSSSQTVVGIQGKPVSDTSPAIGQTLAWNGTAYVPTTPSSGGGSFITIDHSFSGAGTTNYTHSLGTLYPLMTCYVNSGSSAYTASNVDTNNIAITVTAASDITCTFGI